MYSKFHYILIGLIAIVVYLIYLIGYYKIQEYETDGFTQTLIAQSNAIDTRNAEKEYLTNLIHTPAYQTLVAKSTQNKKLPGEEVVNIVTEEEVSGNADIDPQTVLSQTKQEINDPTKDMSNPEKWFWLLRQGIGG